MNYNAVISVRDISDDSGTITEPVTLQEMKDYLRLEGYVDTDQSTSDSLSNFTFDDALIRDMITASRQLMEETLNMSLVFHTWEAVLNNGNGMQEIPYGPVIRFWYVKDKDGVSLDYTTIGNLWYNLKTPVACGLIVTYDAGYGDTLTQRLPKGIKIDLMRLTAYMYEHRGDETNIENFVSQLARKYSRNTWIV